MSQYFWKGLPPGAGGVLFPPGRLPQAFASGLSWQPGVTYNGGIPVRNSIYTTLSPKGTLPVASITSVSGAAVLTLSSGSMNLNDRFGFLTTGALPTGAFPQVTYQVSNVITTSPFSCNFSGVRSGLTINTSDAGFGTHTVELDDSGNITTQCQNAAANFPGANVVLMNAGVFKIYTSIFMPNAGAASNFTLRGAGTGTGCSGGIFLPTDGIGAGGVVTGNISGTTLTVTNMYTGGLSVGCTVQDSGLNNFKITAQLTSTAPGNVGGQQGTYSLNGSATVASGTMTIQAPAITQSGTGTLLLKRERGVNQTGIQTAADGVLAIGPSDDPSHFSDSTFLTADTVVFGNPAAFQCKIATASNPGLAVGDYCMVNEQTFNDTLFATQSPTTTATAATTTGSVLALASVANILTGMTVQDVTNGGAIQNGTTVQSINIGASQITLSLPVAGGGVGINDQISFPPTAGVTQIFNCSMEPDIYWFPDVNVNPRYFSIVHSYSQQETKKITAISSAGGTDTITFETPFRYPMKVSHNAQLHRFDTNQALQMCVNVGFEDFSVAGGQTGESFFMVRCAKSWVRNVETYYQNSEGFTMSSNYRSEIRDSFAHEVTLPQPGGEYLCALGEASSECLLENNVFWQGNKVLVMQGSGSGNVVGYNYADDAFGKFYPTAPESGLNAAHWVGTHMDLFEGNYCFNYNGDQFWGGALDITVFRNHFSGLRAAAGPLQAYLNGTDSYVDIGGNTGRYCVSIGYGHVRYNFVGNVLGYSTQVLINYSNGIGGSWTETAFQYEYHGTGPPQTTGPPLVYVGGTGFFGPENTNLATQSVAYMWQTGWDQAIDRVAGGLAWFWGTTSIQTFWRTGNFDWFTGKQIWYANIGDIGTSNTGASVAIPNSLYIPGGGAPAFWSGTTNFSGSETVTPAGGAFPWVDPSTGATHTLPAKSRFQTWSGIATIPPGHANL